MPSDEMYPQVVASDGQEENELIFSDEMYPQMRCIPQ